MALGNVGDTVKVPRSAGTVTIDSPTIASVEVDETGKGTITLLAHGATLVRGSNGGVGIVIVNDGPGVAEGRLHRLTKMGLGVD